MKKREIVITAGLITVSALAATIGACSCSRAQISATEEMLTMVSPELQSAQLQQIESFSMPPTITGIQSLITEQNSVIDIMQGIIAKSSDGSDITDDITVYPYPDFSTIGSQMISYTVIDFNGVSETQSTILQIVEQPVVVEPVTEEPTQAPTKAYIAPAPTEAVTQAPTTAPTQAPTVAPTQAPTEAPKSSGIVVTPNGSRDITYSISTGSGF